MPEQRPEAGPWPDVTLYAPTEELTETAGDIAVGSLRAHAVPNKKGKRRRRGRTLEHAALDLYGGFDGLLVRTALIRSEDYDERDLPVVRGGADVAEMCKHLIHAPEEYMVTISLDNANRARAINEVAKGPAGHVGFSAQQLLKVAFLTTASSLIMVHNHPSGDPRPSWDDKKTTAKLIEAAKCVDLTILDHVIVADKGWVSLSSEAPSGDLMRVGEIGEARVEPWI
jgi:hypothetical protein